MVYIRNETADILELFDDLLIKHGIKIESPEDDEREEGNDAALYGSTYGELFDEVECMLMHICENVKAGEEVVYGWK